MVANWFAKLTRPLSPPNHAPLVTLADAIDYIVETPPQCAAEEWRAAAELMFVAAQAGSADHIEAATAQLERVIPIA